LLSVALDLHMHYYYAQVFFSLNVH